MRRTIRLNVRTTTLLVFAIAAAGYAVVGGVSNAQQQPDDAGVAYEGHPLPSHEGDYFMASRGCIMCHRGLSDQANNDISMDRDWAPSMHANAATDPYWRASVRAEVLEHPALREVIEDKCATCHTPMARLTTLAAGGDVALLDGGFLDTAHPLYALAIDGVSCTTCHQIQLDDLGDQSSFSGRFNIALATTAEHRTIYGRHEPDPDAAAMMARSSGFTLAQSDHLVRSAFCATCHTLYTPYLDAETGEVVGEFPEQTPFLEWIASDFAAESSCQGCHMPEVVGDVVTSRLSDTPRSHVRRHQFWGANTYMLRIFQQFGGELDVAASGADLEMLLQLTTDKLGQETAQLSLSETALSGTQLSGTVTVESQVGHKFPTGFPSRRAWLHVVVRDAGGDVVFESGAVADNGSIAGNDNDADAAAFEPHYATIETADQVQIYESIMGDTADRVTTTLLLAGKYLKDNRLLPRGFDKEIASDDIAVAGQASGDEDFVGGSDRVRYVIDIGDATGPFTIDAELLFQAIGYRWAENLRRYDAAETSRFMRFYDAVPNTPVVVATISAQVTP